MDCEKNKISIIVPIYNVEAYLKQCIDSLLAQCMKNIEIILVDDGSTDTSGRICDNYAINDERVKVIHQDNQGLSAARNKGVAYSGGDYIAFVDSDDYVSEYFIERLYTLMMKYKSDIAICDYTRTTEFVNYSKDYVIDSQTMLRQWHGKRKRVETVCWNKLYKREVLIPFPEGAKHEDIYTSHLIIEKANLIAITKDRLYYYRKRNGSIKGDHANINAELEAQKARMKYFKDKKYYRSYARCLAGHIAYKLIKR
jgi:glycosyltransferase involved in cell wall biosynthesis